jgi:hypothetical protein
LRYGVASAPCGNISWKRNSAMADRSLEQARRRGQLDRHSPLPEVAGFATARLRRAGIRPDRGGQEHEGAPPRAHRVSRPAVDGGRQGGLPREAHSVRPRGAAAHGHERRAAGVDRARATRRLPSTTTSGRVRVGRRFSRSRSAWRPSHA